MTKTLSQRVQEVLDDAQEALKPHSIILTFHDTALVADIAALEEAHEIVKDQHLHGLETIANLRAQPLPQGDVAPTERMCDAARGFILGLDAGYRTWHSMVVHLDRGGYNCTARIRKMAEEQPDGHITKWDVAETIWQLMDCVRVTDAISAMGNTALVGEELLRAAHIKGWNVCANDKCEAEGWTEGSRNELLALLKGGAR